jgi:hypothetical protein
MISHVPSIRQLGVHGWLHELKWELLLFIYLHSLAVGRS